MLSSPCLAQQGTTDPARLIDALQRQREMAWTMHAHALAQASALSDEIVALRARISELEKQIADKREK
jgi:hypothetical protein